MSELDHAPRFGLVLPHFGRRVEPARMLSLAVQAERLGFDSLWVRDRLGAAAPHGLVIEAGGTRFLEPLLTLAAVAAVTDRIILGTAVLTPVRHPLKLLQDIGTLSAIAGQGRIILGMGLGVSGADLEAVGYSFEYRVALFEETMEVLRRGCASSRIEYRGKHFGFQETEIDPHPPRDLRFWYGGTSRAAVRRALRFTDGWLAGRLPVDTFADRIRYLRGLEEEEEERRPLLEVATQPITILDSDASRARRQAGEAVAVLARSSEGASDWIRPSSGRFEGIEDLSGMLIVGSSEECRREVGRLLDIGINHIIFDLRLKFEAMEEAMEMIAQAVLPERLPHSH